MFTYNKSVFKQTKNKIVTVIKAKEENSKPRLNGLQRLKEGCFILGLLTAILMMVALFSFDPADPSWSQTAWGGTVHNAGGYFGSWLADTLFFTFGSFAYPIPFIILFASWTFFRKRSEDEEIDLLLWGTRLLGLTIMLLTSCGLADINFDDIWYFSSGGVVGDVLTSLSMPALNVLGSTLVFMFLWGAGFTLLTGISWLTIVEAVGNYGLSIGSKILNRLRGSDTETLSSSVEQDFTLPSQGLDELTLAPLAIDAVDSDEVEPILTASHDDVDVQPSDFEPVAKKRFNIHFPSRAKRAEKKAAKMAQDLEAQVGSFSAMAEEDIDDPLFAPRITAPVAQDKTSTAAIETDIGHGQLAAESLPQEASTIKPELAVGQDEFLATQDRYQNPHATIAELDQHAQQQDDFVRPDETAQSEVTDAVNPEMVVATSSLSAQQANKSASVDAMSGASQSMSEPLEQDISSAMHVESQDELESIACFSAQAQQPMTAVEQQAHPVESTPLAGASSMDVHSQMQSSTSPSQSNVVSASVVEQGPSSAEPFIKPTVDSVIESATATTNVDQDAAAFQAMVAREQAAQAALQNPFLMQSDVNLPKPTSPMPTLELLYHPEKRENFIDRDALEEIARLVESKLADYKIEARVVDIFPGPVITRFELDLAPGVKVSRISGLSMDLARSLSAMAVRVVEVIPGKPYVGLELPNMSRETVYLSDVISSEQFINAKSPTTVVLGQDIAGEAVVADLAKMPHVLVAGTTGSGKSVGVNVMILSILYKATPEDVRFIMIDPKMLELSIYEGIPHLLSEVVTDMKDASNALRWCVGEMERRYKMMSAIGVRNLKGYNEKLKMAAEAGHPIYDPLWQPGDSMDETPPLLEKLPSIVVIVDEFADLMMVVGKKVEELIARLAQKARAAGIHLVLATQRPSVDVITGLIKANIPTRVAFTVSTKTDSRTILDQSGAESLLGMGDMLYLPPGSNHTVRVHGAFASDDDVHAVVNDWKARGRPVYIDEIVHGEPSAESLLPGEQLEGEEDVDPLYDQVVEFVTESRRGSVSGVQRRFKIGYNRAARIVEQLEAQGVVSAPGHNGNREVIAPPPIKQFD